MTVSAPGIPDALHRQPRTLQQGRDWMVVSGRPWATQAGADILQRGGNAFDAAAATLLALNVSYPAPAGFASVAPTLLYHAASRSVLGYCGLGTAPAAATIEALRGRGHRHVPKLGILAQLLPSGPDALLAVLSRFGTLGFAEVSAEAIRLAREGFPLDDALLTYLDLNLVQRAAFAWLMPYNARVYFGGRWWRRLRRGQTFRQPDLAATLQAMADTEAQVRMTGGSREQGLDAVRAYFYDGPIAEAIARLHQEQGGFITRADLAGYHGYWEAPVSGTFRGCTVYANQTWTQGPVVPLALQILDGVDLQAMGHNSAAYIHTVTQALELAMADREAFFGDPAFVAVPIHGLLQPAYAAARRRLMTPDAAFGRLPPPGDPWQFQAGAEAAPAPATQPLTPARDGGLQADTSYLAIVDRERNAVSMTPSDFPRSPMVPGTGICLGNRMGQFRLAPGHPNALAPGKRPRLTPNPSMVFRDGRLLMALGTPGLDMQPQAIVQVLLNRLVFRMDIQQAVSAPRFRSHGFPASYAPNVYHPGVLELEAPLAPCSAALRARGYRIRHTRAWHHQMGSVCAVEVRGADLLGGADPRESSWAQGG